MRDSKWLKETLRAGEVGILAESLGIDRDPGGERSHEVLLRQLDAACTCTPSRLEGNLLNLRKLFSRQTAVHAWDTTVKNGLQAHTVIMSGYTMNCGSEQDKVNRDCLV